MQVRLLSAMPTYDVKTGKYMIQLSFGEIIQSNPEIAARLPSTVDPSALTEVGVNKVILIVNLDEARYFEVGGLWDLQIKENGEVSLKPMEAK